MELARIERYVGDRLEMSGIKSQSVGLVVYTALRHVLMAVGIHETMTSEERTLFEHMLKETQQYFASKFNLKERKRSKEKKNLPPHPLHKEKETKEKEKQNPPTVCDAREAFHQECWRYVEIYDSHSLEDFYNFWSEANPKTGKMRFQGKRYWNTETRLKRWMNNQYSAADAAAAIRLKRAKKQQAVDDEQKVRALAAEREMADAQREAEMEKSREGQMTTAEYIKANPDSLMARIYREKNKGVGPQGASKL